MAANWWDLAALGGSGMKHLCSCPVGLASTYGGDGMHGGSVERRSEGRRLLSRLAR
jgi:hypothetical protein